MCGVFLFYFFFFFSSRRRHTRLQGDWSSDVCSSDLSSLGGRIVSPLGVVEWPGFGALRPEKKMTITITTARPPSTHGWIFLGSIPGGESRLSVTPGT